MGTPGIAECTTGGAIPAPANSLTRIVTPQAGWSGVNNPAPAVPGTNRETDADLRLRYASGVFRLGAGVLPAIDANVRNDIPGVVFAKTYENTGDTADLDGRPPHSIELVVDGGDDDAIAIKLFTVKGAGITAHGNTTITVRDVDGFLHPVKFSRPVLSYTWLRVQRVADTEAPIAMPGDVDERIKQAVMTWANGGTYYDYKAGADVTILPQAFVGANLMLQHIAAHILRSVPGLARVNVTAFAQAAASPAPVVASYGTTDIAMGYKQRAALDPTRITVFA